MITKIIFDALHFTIMASEGVPRAKFTKFIPSASAFGLRPNFLKRELRLRPNVKYTASVILCYKVTKISPNLCLHFEKQDGQDGKKRKENHATKVTKIPKTKRQKYGMNRTK